MYGLFDKLTIVAAISILGAALLILLVGSISDNAYARCASDEINCVGHAPDDITPKELKAVLGNCACQERVNGNLNTNERCTQQELRYLNETHKIDNLTCEWQKRSNSSVTLDPIIYPICQPGTVLENGICSDEEPLTFYDHIVRAFYSIVIPIEQFFGVYVEPTITTTGFFDNAYAEHTPCIGQTPGEPNEGFCVVVEIPEETPRHSGGVTFDRTVYPEEIELAKQKLVSDVYQPLKVPKDLNIVTISISIIIGALAFITLYWRLNRKNE